MRVTMRPARPDDADHLIRLDPAAPAGPRRTALIRQRIAAGECFVAETDASPIGYAAFNHSFFDHGWLELLDVRPACRRHGVGSALVRYCEAICLTPKRFTSTNLSNTPMQRLLAKQGFAMSGFIENLDVGDPELVFVKIRPPGVANQSGAQP